jgi:hypothetical protein
MNTVYRPFMRIVEHDQQAPLLQELRLRVSHPIFRTWSISPVLALIEMRDDLILAM